MTGAANNESRHGAYNGWCRVVGIPLKAKDCPECVIADAESSTDVSSTSEASSHEPVGPD